MPEILVGQKFEKLTVLEKAGTAKYGILWRCICECGNYTNVLTVNLNRRHTKSCGCLHNPQFMPKITKKELSALEGELLGDGSIPSVKKGNCRFLLQTVYYGQAKFANDNILSTQPTIKCYQRKASKLSNYKNNSKTDIINVWTVRSKRSPFFNSLRKLWYPNDKKIVPDNFKLNNISALHWFIGDGNNLNGKAVRLYTNGFDLLSVEKLQKQLKNLGIKSNIQNDYKNDLRDMNNYIYIGSKSIIDWFDFIGLTPVVPELHYKWKIRR